MSTSKRSPDRVSLAKVERLAPPLAPLEILRRNLLYAMYKGVSEDDMTAVVADLVKKAKGGDLASQKEIIRMVQADVSSCSPCPPCDADVTFLSDLRRHVAIILATDGPMESLCLADRLHQPLPRVLEAVTDHPWFCKTAHGWETTWMARNEVPGLGSKETP